MVTYISQKCESKVMGGISVLVKHL